MNTIRGFLIIAIIGVAITPLPSNCQSSFQVYLLREEFETALLDSSENKYKLNQIFPLGVEPRLIQCVPVKYFLTCGAQQSSNEGSSQIDCTKGYNASFLWTSFNAESFQGDLLLRWAIDGIHSAGFNWAEACKFDFRFAANFYLKVPELFHGTRESVDEALELLTEMLPAHSARQQYPTSPQTKSNRGYALKWEASDYSCFSTGEEIVNISALVLAVSCLVIAGSVGPRVYKIIFERIKDSKSRLYVFFWSCEIVAACWCWAYGSVRRLFAPHHQLETLVYVYIYAAMILMLPLAVWIVEDRLRRHQIDHLLPVPFLHQHRQDCRNHAHCECVTRPIRMCIYVANILAVWNLFAFLTYMLHTIPSLVLAYYVFPSRTLIKISFIEFSAVVAVIGVASLLYRIEKLYWLIKPGMAERFTQERGLNIQGPIAPSEVDAPSLSKMQKVKKTIASGHKICQAASHVITAFVFIGGALALICIIGAILFETATDNDSDSDFLTILPTIILNAAIWMLHRDFLMVPDELRSLGFMAVKVMKEKNGPEKHKKDKKEGESEGEDESTEGGHKSSPTSSLLSVKDMD